MRRFLEPTGESVLLWGSLIFFASLALMLYGIDACPHPYFDETWYVPTARKLLATGEMLHQEHPPLGKLLISLGILIFGDDPLGWRAMSAVFGSVTLFGMFFWSFALFRDIGAALWVAAATLFNQFVYVQSRIAMLDIFVMAFGTLAMAFFTLSIKERASDRRSFVFALAMGVCLGLAGASKWSGFFLLFGIIGVALLHGVLRLWRVRFDDPRASDFFGRDVWTSMTPGKAAIALGAVPALAYFLTYVPQMVHHGSVLEFFVSHWRMFTILSGDAGTHPYASNWYTWPLLLRPVWYLFEPSAGPGTVWSIDNQVRAIVALANPVLVFAGEIAIAFAALSWLRSRNIDAMIVTVGFFAQYLPWALNPKGLEFSYYYFPALLCTGPALVLMLFGGTRLRDNRLALGLLGLAGLVFLLFLPVLSAQVGVTPRGFGIRVWTSFWR